MFLLDTNVVSELRRPDKADARVLAWAAAPPAAVFYLSAISVFELALGRSHRDAMIARASALSTRGPKAEAKEATL